MSMRLIIVSGLSGSGKSVTARTLVGLTGGRSQVLADRVEFAGGSLLGLSRRQWRDIRGRRIGFVLQDALASLDPLRPVGKEIEEVAVVNGACQSLLDDSEEGVQRREVAEFVDRRGQRASYSS